MFLDLESDKEESAANDSQPETEANEYAESVLFGGSRKWRIAEAKTRADLLFLAADLHLGVNIVAGQHGHLDLRLAHRRLAAHLAHRRGDLEHLELLSQGAGGR